MRLRNVQVKNFRCVEDSTEFTICPMTCLVGKNGAGKTSMLEALYKVNPDVPELGSFDVLMEYPRARRREYQNRAETQPDDAIMATWELEDEDIKTLESVLGPGAVKSKTVVIRKGYYDGRHWTGQVAHPNKGPAFSPPEPVVEQKPQSQEIVGPTDVSQETKPDTAATEAEPVGEEVTTAPQHPLAPPMDARGCLLRSARGQATAEAAVLFRMAHDAGGVSQSMHSCREDRRES